MGVYKTEEGEIRQVDIVCPHMGCQLSWNPDEQSWDCPCHGSRFDVEGNLLDDPAQGRNTMQWHTGVKSQKEYRNVLLFCWRRARPRLSRNLGDCPQSWDVLFDTSGNSLSRWQKHGKR
ncbi:MAG: Rieske 2Fe-2S domain-containing protein [Sellimonas intestinalis]